MKDLKLTAVVAMSGGVDSSVTALMLQQQGYNVIGLTGRMVNSPSSDIVADNANVLQINLVLNIMFLMPPVHLKIKLLIIL